MFNMWAHGDTKEGRSNFVNSDPLPSGYIYNHVGKLNDADKFGEESLQPDNLAYIQYRNQGCLDEIRPLLAQRLY